MFEKRCGNYLSIYSLNTTSCGRLFSAVIDNTFSFSIYNPVRRTKLSIKRIYLSIHISGCDILLDFEYDAVIFSGPEDITQIMIDMAVSNKHVIYNISRTFVLYIYIQPTTPNRLTNLSITRRNLWKKAIHNPFMQCDVM